MFRRACATVWRSCLVALLLGVAAAFVAPAWAGAQEPADTTTTTAATGAPRIVATLTVGDDAEPLKGVVMVVELDGEEVGTATSDADGVVAVEVPGAGQYTVFLDESTLPDDVVFEADAPTELSPRVQATGDRSVIFRLATADGDGAPTSGGGGGTPMGERVGNLFASGLRFGLVIALAAVGLSLVFGTTGLTNFAHGELIAFGAIVAWYLNANDGGLGLPLAIATLGAIVAGALFGASFELGVYRPLRRRGMPVVSQMVVSIGLAFALRYLFSIVFGAGAQQFSQYAAQAPTIDVGPISLRPKDVIIIAVASLCLVAVGLFLQRARIGTAIRAVSDNRDLSVASGIDDNRVVLIVWLMAGAMAGLSGVMLGTTEFIGWNMGQRVLLVMFAAVLLGGLGTTFGAMFGGIFVGVVSDLSTLWLDADLKIVVALATLVAVLLVRPQGVFGVKARTA
jgi:branched-chain amino acid transport system permease protein